jgi:ABC-type nitrate/sulfonate/bicarbonate transport system ATPase subunit
MKNVEILGHRIQRIGKQEKMTAVTVTHSYEELFLMMRT